MVMPIYVTVQKKYISLYNETNVADTSILERKNNVIIIIVSKVI